MKNTSESKKALFDKEKAYKFNKIVLFSANVIGILVLSVFFLLSTPAALNVLESSIFILPSEQFSKNPVLNSDVSAAPQKNTLIVSDLKIVPPILSAVGILAQDYESGQILYQKNSQSRLAPASTTKIMTALVSMDHFKSTDVLIVPQESIVGGSTMGLVAGEKLTYRSLLLGMMLNSGNDAAFAIAANYPGGSQSFIDAMNKRALQMGLSNTHFQNPAGFDHPDHYSSASDLAVIARTAASQEQLAKVVATKDITVTSIDKVYSHRLQNLNKLLTEDGVIGIKTGYTEQAGENLVGLVDRNGHKVLTVILGSTNRFEETKLLMDWVYKNFSWEK